jgi:hypothetical protein
MFSRYFLLGFACLSLFCREKQVLLGAGGKIVQQVNYSSADMAYSQKTIAGNENTLPAFDAGTTWTSVEITPLQASSKLWIEGTIYVSSNPSPSQLVIFDGISETAVATFYNLNGNLYDFGFYYTPGGSGPITFTFQYGAIGAGDPVLTVINGMAVGTNPSDAVPIGGGKCYSTISISEIAPDAAPYTLGQYAEGGVVFWLDATGYHGLAAAIVDQDGGSGVAWYNDLNISTNAFAQGVYLGLANTNTIKAVQGAGTYAATVASNYSVTVEGVTYNDWYLPSSTEANLMFQNLDAINATSLAHGGTEISRVEYWTSTEVGLNYVWNQDFNNGSQNGKEKSYPYKVRAIRCF